MDRRTFMQAAAASTGSVAVSGCLDDGDEVVSEDEEGPPRYSVPLYSVWPPTESHDTGGVVFMHMELRRITAVMTALDGDAERDGLLFDLPLLSAETVPGAVETLSSYPFAARLREAVNTAATAGAGRDDTNETVVEPIEEPVELANETSGAGLDSNTTNTTGNSTGSVTVGSFDTEPAQIEVTELTLTDDVVLFHGAFDQELIANRYAAGFQQVDEQRGIQIYEGRADGEELAFGVSPDVLIVPTEDPTRESPAETVLAHVLSGYINTLGRVVDDEDGEWLFETTGPTALSLGVWGASDPLARIAETVGRPGGEAVATDPIFDSVEAFVTALAVTADNEETITEFETRFAGLYPESMPTDEAVRSLVDGADSQATYREEPRLQVTASYSETE